MDWSMLRPHVKPRFLRAELVYTDHIPVSNIHISMCVFP